MRLTDTPTETADAGVPRLHGELEQQLAAQKHELETLLAVQQAITSRLERQEVLQMIADGARRLIQSSVTAVYLLEGDMLRLAVISSAPDGGQPPHLTVGYQIPVGQSFGRIAFETRKPLLIADVQKDERFHPDLRRRINIHSYLGVPLFVQHKPLGLLVAVDKKSGPLSVEDERVLSLLASSAVIGLENARLYEEAEKNAALAERERLARDLHDAVTQTLFSISIIAEVLPKIWEVNPAEGRRRLEQLRQSTRGALAEMRTLLLELRPAALQETTLSELLKHLVNAFTGRTQIPVDLVTEETSSLTGEAKICFYRIAQESLNNIGKYAEAGRVKVHYLCTPARASLEITDDGLGFDPTGVGPNHFGLQIMKERAQTVNAVFNICSRPGAGTTIQVCLNSHTDASPQECEKKE